MTVTLKYAYHVTDQATALKIIESGVIDPKFSQGKNPVCWYVSRAMIPWAIAHVAQRKDVGIDQIAIFTVFSDREKVNRSSKRGVYYCAFKMKIVEMHSATIWLQREEISVFIQGKNGSKVYARKNNGSFKKNV